MGNPLRIAILTLFAPLLAFAGEAVDDSSGTKISHSDEWRREASIEQGARRISLARPVEDGKFMRLTVEVGSADGFDADEWLAGEKMSWEKALSEPTEIKVDKAKTIAGLSSTGFSTSGNIKEASVRLRCYIVQRDAKVIVFREFSFNGAHEKIGDEEIEKLWDGISFQEAVTEVGGGGDEAAKPTEIVDQPGNMKYTMPGTWQLVQPAPAEAKGVIRGVFHREDENRDRVMEIAIFRYEEGNAEIFKKAPVEVIEMIIKRQVFSPYYGDGSDATITRNLRIDEGKQLGGADVTAGFIVSSRTMKQMEAVRKAEEDKRKGIKGVEIPEFKPTVVRGRVALLSPHIYLVYAQFRADVADNPQLIKEYETFVDSLTLIAAKPKPPQLVVGAGGKPIRIGNTMEDPALAEERKDEVNHSERGRKLYEVEYSFKLPPGFQRVEGSTEGNRAFLIVAQDGENRWFTLTINAVSKRATGDKKGGNVALDWSFDKDLDSWKSNWESKARGSKVKKEKNVRIGNIKGKGWEGLEGEIDGWPATFTCCVGDEEGWRNLIEVETRGGFAKKYGKDIKKLLKSIRIREK